MNEWKLDDGRTIWLLTEEEFDSLPDGTKVICIDGRVFTKGIHHIDRDTRCSYMAFGLEE